MISKLENTLEAKFLETKIIQQDNCTYFVNFTKMADTIKDYVSPKRFSSLAYVCVIIHFNFGLILTAITTALRLGETEKFSCAVDTHFVTHKTYVEKTCFSIYDDAYNSPVRFYAFVVVNFGLVIIVSVIYSLAVGSRIDETERYSTGSDESQTVGKKGNNEQGRKTFFVFYFYVLHLVARSMLGILFTILQHTLLYRSGFKSQFSCIYPEIPQPDPNITTTHVSVTLSNVTCNNSAAKDKQFWGTIVSVCNIMFTLITLLEVIYVMSGSCIIKRLPCFKPRSWSCDAEFITVHFLRKQYVPENLEFTGVGNCSPNCAKIYKEKVLMASFTMDTMDINFGPKTNVNDMFIDVAIQTGQVPHKFPNIMHRHEIYDVYMEVPKDSVRLDRIEDLFYPNKDTKGNYPRIILALGRPGIGKTVLTRKILYDWANEVDEFYCNKIVFLFKFRCFSFDEYQSVTLKKFLRIGTELNEDEFESIFDMVIHDSKKIIIIFDGLDEFCSNLKEFKNYVDQSKTYSTDPNALMPAKFLFIKIMFGYFLEKATILVTSRPTASDVYSKLNNIDRKVEIIGFTSEKIEEYVKQFCVQNNKPELKPVIWNYIKSSSELKNLCYIPVNCFIVCGTLFNCLSHPTHDIRALPTTLTELYQAALVYFHNHMNHDRNNSCNANVTEKLQQLAFYGMMNDKLIFKGEMVNEQMKESGLLHSLPVPVSPIQAQTQFCFIHLTVQEFLAAKHIVETKEPEDIKEFISFHVEEGKWHLVLQFLAGLLRRKMNISDQYRSCVLAFTGHLSGKIEGGQILCNLDSSPILVMKCLREIEDEKIAKETAVTSALKDVTRIQPRFNTSLTSSDWAAMAFVCKHLNLLTDLHLPGSMNLECFLEVTRLLQERCIKTVSSSSRICGDLGLEHLLGALMKCKCLVNHQHSKLTELRLIGNNIADTGVIHLAEFLKHGYGNCLKVLNLRSNSITSRGMSKLCNVLNNEACNKLTVLGLCDNGIGDEGVGNLSKALIEKQLKLTRLYLSYCLLTSECIPWLAKAISDKHCEITHLSLKNNEIRDGGIRTLCCVLLKEQCKLSVLDLSSCSLTDECMTALFEALGGGHCGLTNLKLNSNEIGDEGAAMLFCALMKEQCKLTGLEIFDCLLTGRCMPSLCRALGDARCRLTKLNVGRNGFENSHLSSLSDTLKLQNCCLQSLDIGGKSITEEGKKLLRDVEDSEYCKARGLKITV